MRKEVKLGMAIGGGLVALLIAYLLIAPPSNNKKGTQLVDGTKVVDVTQPGDLGAEQANANVQPQNNTQLVQNGGQATNDPAKLDAPKTEEKPKATGDSWKDQLDKGKKPEVVKTNETTDPSKTGETAKTTVVESNIVKHDEQPRVAFNPNDAWGGGLSTDGVGSARPVAKTTLISSSPTTRPSTKAGQHIVKSGETFSSIALAEYGSSAFYPHLIRANPTVNPNNLKLGTVINVPALDDVKGPAADVTTGQTVHANVVEPKIDPSKQYKVQSGDSLYKISVKLYGKGTYVDKIYEKNKAAIGPNPTKLKLGMILELPEAVSGTGNASAAQNNGGTLVSDTPTNGVVESNEPK